MNNNDTIIALSTPNGLGAISVIRISGPDSISTTENLFVAKGNKKLSQMKSHTVHLGHLIKNGFELDEVLITLFKGPNSYNEKLKSILGKLNNKAFIEKAPDNVIENFRIQEQEMKSSIEKINEIINTIN